MMESIIHYYRLPSRVEFDSIAATRGGLEDGMSSRRLLSELLLQLTEQKQIQAQESRALVLKLSKTTNSSINNYDQKSKRKSYTDLLGEGKMLVTIPDCWTELTQPACFCICLTVQLGRKGPRWWCLRRIIQKVGIGTV